MNLKSLYLLILSIALLSCNSSNSTDDQLPTHQFTIKEIGWTIEIPPGFKLKSKEKLDADNKRGKEAIEKVYEGEVNTDSFTQLVSFSKNQFNGLTTTIEPYKEKKRGEYDENNILIKKLLFDTYQKQGIKTDTSSNYVAINGLKFNVFYIKVYGPDGSVILNQVMYSKMIKGYDFGVNVNYNNEIDKKLLNDAFMKSKFQ